MRSSRLCRSLPRESKGACYLAHFKIRWTKAVVWGQAANRGRERTEERRREEGREERLLNSTLGWVFLSAGTAVAGGRT